jgi:hypothetical protein
VKYARGKQAEKNKNISLNMKKVHIWEEEESVGMMICIQPKRNVEWTLDVERCSTW